jgi:hypothetical protein
MDWINLVADRVRMAGSHWHGDEPAGSIKCSWAAGGFLGSSQMCASRLRLVASPTAVVPGCCGHTKRVAFVLMNADSVSGDGKRRRDDTRITEQRQRMGDTGGQNSYLLLFAPQRAEFARTSHLRWYLFKKGVLVISKRRRGKGEIYTIRTWRRSIQKHFLKLAHV